jgi:hypothetical protein
MVLTQLGLVSMRERSRWSALIEWESRPGGGTTIGAGAAAGREAG